ncbi:SEL1-like repeat protein [Rhodovulum sp. YNF3179]|uniref:SEL1-like repeat protein n=1 Tax=Rhodovulum sp. YNF3179 TaxID=3425127 RepID=UPI003D333FB0
MTSLKTAAARGEVEAQLSLSLRYERGIDVPQDAKMAEYWLARAAENDHSGAQWKLANNLLLKGDGDKFDKALMLLLRSAVNGEKRAIAKFRKLLQRDIEENKYYIPTLEEGHEDEFKSTSENHRGYKKQKNLSARKKTIPQGTEAQFSGSENVGKKFDPNDREIKYLKLVPKDIEKVYYWYRVGFGSDSNCEIPIDKFGEIEQERAAHLYSRAINEKNAEFQFRLGALIWSRRSSETDRKVAGDLFEAAANQGLAEAQYRIAKLFDHGLFGRQSDEDAAYWYGKAAAQGVCDAQYRLAQFFLNARGVARDLSEARRWCALASREGDKRAKKLLLKIDSISDSELLERSRGYQEDLDGMTERLQNFLEVKVSAEGGDGRSQFILGGIFEEGVFVKKNLFEAAKWYREAKKNKIRNAEGALERVDFLISKAADMDSGAPEIEDQAYLESYDFSDDIDGLD